MCSQYETFLFESDGNTCAPTDLSPRFRVGDSVVSELNLQRWGQVVSTGYSCEWRCPVYLVLWEDDNEPNQECLDLFEYHIENPSTYPPLECLLEASSVIMCSTCGKLWVPGKRTGGECWVCRKVEPTMYQPSHSGDVRLDESALNGRLASAVIADSRDVPRHFELVREQYGIDTVNKPRAWADSVVYRLRIDGNIVTLCGNDARVYIDLTLYREALNRRLASFSNDDGYVLVQGDCGDACRLPLGRVDLNVDSIFQ